MRIKELGLEAGHAEKDGVLVALTDLVSEVRRRLARRLDEEEQKGVEAVRLGVEGLGKVEEDTKKEA